MPQRGETSARVIASQLRSLANPEDARQQARYFKTGPGEYGEGDQFLGIRIPVLRQLARQYDALPLEKCIQLLQSPIHEQRMLALLIMIRQYPRADEVVQKRLYQAYLKQTEHINNWDLVDVSAPRIVGQWLYTHPKDRALLGKLAASPILWRRRIAVIATLYFIQQGQFSPTLRLARALLDDRHDLIHKAVGWMLREVGKRELAAERDFLDRYAARMPRTMLRYAIEKFPARLRQDYLQR